MMEAARLLGFGPVYHFKELLRTKGKDSKDWMDVENGTSILPDKRKECVMKPRMFGLILGIQVTQTFDKIFHDYHSTFDYPAAMYPRALYDAYPDAKFILVRSPCGICYVPALIFDLRTSVFR